MTYISNSFVRIFNNTNSVRGASPISIEGKSGFASFTDVISANTTSTFVITNSYFTSSSAIFFQLYYNSSSGSGKPCIISVNRLSAPSVEIVVDNSSGSPTDLDIVIGFQIMS